MPVPLAVGLMLGATAVGASANLYSQYKQRQLFRYQRGGYERKLADWEKNVGKGGRRTIRYPELSYPGHIRALDTGISQSYAASLGSLSSVVGRTAGSTLYRPGASRSLYSRSAGRSSRYL